MLILKFYKHYAFKTTFSIPIQYENLIKQIFHTV